MTAVRLSAGALLLAFAVAPAADAQTLGGFIKDRAKDRLKQKIAECIATDLSCIRKAKEAGQEVKIKDAPPEASAAGAGASGAATMKPGEGAWVNYDFKPGDQPLFVEDFRAEDVGNFPRRLEFIDGNMEVAEWNGGRYLRVSTWPGKFAIVLPDVLPERFTLEFDITPGYSSNWTVLRFADYGSVPHDIRFRTHDGGKGNAGIFGDGMRANGMTPEQVGTLPHRARIMADGRYVKVYINETRVANVPNADIGRSNTISFEVPGHNSAPVMIANISLMAGGRKLYDALTESGRVATQGIYFDTGSDRLRPESTPTLKEIGAMLNEHADLALTIEGHTDNVGNAEANRELAERRAAAVKAFLVSTYSVDEGRLQAVGVGDAKPAAPNTTPEGRQQNRRVELVRR
ncbi:MAG TPA: OmpA family protein [Vicinamibacterales bacterium]|nr:OmpA family protein [Vicinamibacterales bacterium]